MVVKHEYEENSNIQPCHQKIKHSRKKIKYMLNGASCFEVPEFQARKSHAVLTLSNRYEFCQLMVCLCVIAGSQGGFWYVKQIPQNLKQVIQFTSQTST